VQQGLRNAARTQALARKWAEAAQHMDSLTAGATGGMGAWDRLGGIFEGRWRARWPAWACRRRLKSPT
jgi:hypothetical protein